ncbi:hypothetical protein LOK49_LG08G00439 [Camellia lanceoleosa]|uniref:Uncharacterized protein n=1 Tax=Camellia lanceoleosa TaxID=1840588 RepID=A0ACC0GV45_9ERIC|nr:hypothetical protein LOK49_LG08G00439 [Camellia lanceoleosa]
MAAPTQLASSSSSLGESSGLLLEEGSGENEDLSHLCLVGKILAPKTLNKGAVTTIIQAAWRIRGDLTISPWSDNIFLFQFSDEEDRHHILRDSPWSVMGWLLVLQPLSSGKSAEEIDFKWCQFWVQVHGLPVQKLTKQNGEILGNRIGRLVRVEAHAEGLLLYRSFLRIRMEIDIQQPLPRGLWLQRGQGQSDSWLTFKYEKLSNFCYDCGRLGHENHTCKFVSKEQGTSSGYGPGLRTGSAGPTRLPLIHYRRQVDDLGASLSPILFGRRTAVTPPPSSTPASDNPDQGPMSEPEPFLPRSSSSTQGTPMSTIPVQEKYQNTPNPNLPRGGPMPTTSVSDSSQLHSFSPSPAGPLLVLGHTAHPLIQAVNIRQPTQVGLPTETNYYIIEPPDSPCHSGASQGMTPKFFPAPSGDTWPLNPAHNLEGGLSKALQHLSLKRKVIGELECDLHHTKVQKVGQSVPLLQAPPNT